MNNYKEIQDLEDALEEAGLQHAWELCDEEETILMGELSPDDLYLALDAFSDLANKVIEAKLTKPHHDYERKKWVILFPEAQISCVLLATKKEHNDWMDSPRKKNDGTWIVGVNIFNGPDFMKVAKVVKLAKFNEVNKMRKINKFRRVRRVAEGPREWPVYRKEEDKEYDEFYALFGIELREDEDWGGFGHYWHDGAPEWSDEGRDYSSEYRTGIVVGGGYLSPAKETIEDEEGTWELVNVFSHSGETDCSVCGHGTGNLFAEGFEEAYDRPPTAEDRCGLCETEYEDQPGYIYVGDSYEAVYKLVEDEDEEDWDEDEDY